MTEIPDLIAAPQARWSFLLQSFVDDLRAKQKKDEAAIDRMVEECRTRLHRLHLKTESTFKRIFDELLVRMNNDEGAEAAAWFEFILKTKRLDLVAEVLARAAPVIREIEKSGGELEMDIRKAGAGSGGCMYRDRRGGYFSFCGEFLDGFDDDYVYVVRREQKSKAEKERERESRLDAHIAEWQAKERAKRVEAIDAIIADGLGGQLQETSAEEAVARCGDGGTE